jgi:hypothetical protein
MPKRLFSGSIRTFGNRDPGINYLLFAPFILRYKDDPALCSFLPQSRAACAGGDFHAQIHLTWWFGERPLIAI